MLKQITKGQYLKIVGLLTLAEAAVARLTDIESAIRSTLQVVAEDEETSGVGDPGHIGDAIYSGYTPEELLEKLGITYAE